MLIELSVRDLGVIGDLSLVLDPGMTVLTGETGAGKTLIVQAIQLLAGGRSDPGLVRPGTSEAIMEGRFLDGDDEVVVRRIVPAEGRGRSYLDGHMASAADLSVTAERFVDLHGQHTHQSLLAPAVQRRALDTFGGIDLGPLASARSEVADVSARLEEIGGDARSRAHEMDLLRYQLEELDEANFTDDDEDAKLEAEADLLGDAAAHLEAAAVARIALADDEGVIDGLGTTLAAIGARKPFASAAERLRSAQVEIEEAAAEVRTIAESIEEDPRRMAELRSRRQLIRDLTRKYGDTLGEVRRYGDEARERLDRLDRHEELAAELGQRLDEARLVVAHEAKHVGEARRIAAIPLSDAVTAGLPELAMKNAKLEVCVHGEDPCDDVTFGFVANSGASAQPLAKIASGGELARVMLSLRLVLSAGPETLVFDEVDAGIGGEAAIAVGASLSRLARDHQVLVVTHLPQVAAFADQHVVITKTDDGVGVLSSATHINDDERVIELARMLAGRPDSAAGREHAGELLTMGATARSTRLEQ